MLSCFINSNQVTDLSCQHRDTSSSTLPVTFPLMLVTPGDHSSGSHSFLNIHLISEKVGSLLNIVPIFTPSLFIILLRNFPLSSFMKKTNWPTMVIHTGNGFVCWGSRVCSLRLPMLHRYLPKTQINNSYSSNQLAVSVESSFGLCVLFCLSQFFLFKKT